jgi:hypothetical protein
MDTVSSWDRFLELDRRFTLCWIADLPWSPPPQRGFSRADRCFGTPKLRVVQVNLYTLEIQKSQSYLSLGQAIHPLLDSRYPMVSITAKGVLSG